MSQSTANSVIVFQKNQMGLLGNPAQLYFFSSANCKIRPKPRNRRVSICPVIILYSEMMASDIQGRIKAALALKPGEGESSQAATANVLRNKPSDYHHWTSRISITTSKQQTFKLEPSYGGFRINISEGKQLYAINKRPS